MQPRKKTEHSIIIQLFLWYLSVSLIIVIKVSVDLAEHNFYSMRRPRIGINNKSSQRLFFREKTKEKLLVAQKRTDKLTRKHIAFKPKPNLVHIGGRNASSPLHNIISCAKTISGIKFYSKTGFFNICDHALFRLVIVICMQLDELCYHISGFV